MMSDMFVAPPRTRPRTTAKMSFKMVINDLFRAV
jgi:hypothetical protein